MYVIQAGKYNQTQVNMSTKVANILIDKFKQQLLKYGIRKRIRRKKIGHLD